MKKTTLLKSMLLLCALVVGSSSLWAQSPIVLFHETFGNNENKARDWDDSYSVKSGVLSVYSGITEYTVSNVKQGKNTTGYVQSGMNQSSQGTDAYIIIGPLNVASYNTLKLTYQWKAASITGTYSTHLYYKTSAGGAFTEVSGTGTGATSFVERSYSLPDAAQVSTLYLKIVWNTSNTQAIIDEVDLTGISSSTDPAISVSTTSLSGFTYGVNFGPSTTKTVTVSGLYLTSNISLALGESNYEMSLSESGVYSNSLSLTPSTGTVADTPIYVRLKAGLAKNASYEGTITLTSTGATNKTVTLSASVTDPIITWDLSDNSYSAASEDQVTWSNASATMVVDKGTSSTAANNYLPPTRTSTRFYTNSILTITPTSGRAITSVVFTAASDSYATALKNSSWTNATAAVSGSVVTVTPTIGIDAISAKIGATCGFTEVKVYYAANSSGIVPITPAKEYITLKCAHDLDFTSVSSNIKAYVAANAASSGSITFTGKDAVPAGTPLLIKATTPGTTVNVPVAASTPAAVGTNYLVAGDGGNVTYNAGADHYYYVLTNGEFKQANESPVAVGKAYLALPSAATSNELTINFDDEEAGDVTGIATVSSKKQNNGEYFNLNGQRVDASHKGIVIVNGKKFFNK